MSVEPRPIPLPATDRPVAPDDPFDDWRRPGPLVGYLTASLSVAVALGLAGCGFTPLYGSPGVTQQLAAVEVATPPGRTGQLIREHLDDALARIGDAHRHEAATARCRG